MSHVLLIGRDSETTRSILQALGDRDCPANARTAGRTPFAACGISRSMYSSLTLKPPLRKTWR